MGQIPEQRLLLCQQSYKTPSDGRNEGMRMLTGTYPPFPLPTQTTNAPWSHPAVRPSWGKEGILVQRGPCRDAGGLPLHRQRCAKGWRGVFPCSLKGTQLCWTFPNDVVLYRFIFRQLSGLRYVPGRMLITAVEVLP